MSDPRTLLVAQSQQRARGLRAIRQHEFDVLLVDLNLGDGWKPLRCWNSSSPPGLRHRAVVISVMENDEQVLRAFELGAAGFVGKELVVWQLCADRAAGVMVALHHAPYARRLLQRFDRANAPQSSAVRPTMQTSSLPARKKSCAWWPAATPALKLARACSSAA